MSETGGITGGAGAEGTMGFRNDGVPFSGMAYGQASLLVPTGNDFDLTFNYKMMAGADSYQDGSTPLAGHLDRWVVYRSRLNLVDDTLGITKMNLEAAFPKPGLKLYTGVSPQEDYVYPYNFNSVTLSDGTPVNTLTYNVPDNTSGANIYTLKIGLLGGVAYEPPQLPGLRAVVQTGPDGGMMATTPWVTTGQLGYSSPDYGTGETPASTSVAVYGSVLAGAAHSVAENGNEVVTEQDSKNGVGVFVGQRLGPFQAGAGYAFNRQGDVTTQGVNAALNVIVPGDRLVVASGYSYVGNQTEGEHALEPSTVVVRPWKKSPLVVRGGWIAVMPADNDPLSEPTPQFMAYLGVGYNTSNSVEGDPS